MSALAAARTAHTVRLPVAAPFHLQATVRVLQRRPSNPVDVWVRGRYRRVLCAAGPLALVEVQDRGCARCYGRYEACDRPALRRCLSRAPA
jgi:hypothetical protein